MDAVTEENLRLRIASYAKGIEKIFRDEYNPKVTILVQPNPPGVDQYEADVLVSNADDMDAVIEGIRRLKGGLND